MEKLLIEGLKTFIEKLPCCAVKISNTEITKTPSAEETDADLKKSTNENVSIQQIPKRFKKAQSCQIFTIKNIDSGNQIDIRNENQKDFINKYSELTGTKTDSFLSFYRNKQKMNEKL